MTKQHSKNTRIYGGAYDLSGDGAGLTLPKPRDLMESTAFTDVGEKNIVGPTRGEISIDTLFDDTSGMDAAYEAWLTEQIASFWPAGDALSAIGHGALSTLLVGHPYTSRVADIVRGQATIRNNGQVYRMVSLGTKQSAVTATLNLTSRDDGASSTNGGLFIAHGFAVSASGGSNRWNLHLQHSADNAVWANAEGLIFTNAAGIQAKQVSFTVPSSGNPFNRYTRLQIELEATSGSITCHASYVRF